MKLSERAKLCELSPMRKFHPYAVAAKAQGRKIYHLNIGQPDIETPSAYFEAVRSFSQPVLEYAESPGRPVLIQAVQDYYAKIGVSYDAAGGTICPIPTSPEEGYHYADREKIVSRINENTRAIMITNPSNPTGVILTPEERQLLVDIAREYDLYLISDEVYREFYYGDQGLATRGI